MRTISDSTTELYGFILLAFFLTAKNLVKATNEGKEVMRQSKSLAVWPGDLSQST